MNYVKVGNLVDICKVRAKETISVQINGWYGDSRILSIGKSVTCQYDLPEMVRDLTVESFCPTNDGITIDCYIED